MKNKSLEQGRRIKDLRELNGLSQVELGEKLGVTHTTIGKYERGETENIKRSILNKMSEIFNVSPLYISGYDLADLNLEPLAKVRKLPIIGTICAGDGKWCEEDLEGYFFVDESVKNADFIVNVDGDSMSGDNIRDGDKAFMKSTHYVENGKIAAVLLKTTNEVMLKRVYVKEDHAILQPSNPTYSPITTDNFLISGELVGIYHKVEWEETSK